VTSILRFATGLTICGTVGEGQFVLGCQPCGTLAVGPVRVDGDSYQETDILMDKLHGIPDQQTSRNNAFCSNDPTAHHAVQRRILIGKCWCEIANRWMTVWMTPARWNAGPSTPRCQNLMEKTIRRCRTLPFPRGVFRNDNVTSEGCFRTAFVPRFMTNKNTITLN